MTSLQNSKTNMNVKDVQRLIESFAPLSLSTSFCEKFDDYDNSGLLLYPKEREVSKVLCALDLTASVISEAVEGGYEMILTHHPVIYEPLKELTLEKERGILKLIEAGISVFSAHLNLDSCKNGFNEGFAKACGLLKSEILMPVSESEGILRLGELEKPQSLKDYAETLKQVFHCAVKISAGNPSIQKIAVLNGGGGNLKFLNIAKEQGANLYISGDFHHHAWIEAEKVGIALLEIPHYHAEKFFLSSFVQKLNELAEKDGKTTIFTESKTENAPYFIL